MTDRTKQLTITTCAVTLGALALVAKGIQWANDYLRWQTSRRPLPTTHTASNPIVRYHHQPDEVSGHRFHVHSRQARITRDESGVLWLLREGKPPEPYRLSLCSECGAEVIATHDGNYPCYECGVTL